MPEKEGGREKPTLIQIFIFVLLLGKGLPPDPESLTAVVGQVTSMVLGGVPIF